MTPFPDNAKRLVVTGASGYLGRRLSRIAASQHAVIAAYGQSADSVHAGEAVALNITDAGHVQRVLEKARPDAVIHCAAANPGTSIDTMRQVNIDGSAHIAERCRAMGVRLVHVSTDMVHDGTGAPYEDDDEPTADRLPANVYGQTKAAAESAVKASGAAAAIVRTSLIYGLHEIDRGTAGFVAKLEAREPLTLFSDVIRQPVFADSLAHGLIKLATTHSDFQGCINIAGSQSIDRASFAMRMLDWWGIDYAGRVTTGPSRALENPPPLNLSLTLNKARELLTMQFPGVEEVVEQTD